jgi:hypothetical protein
VLLRSSVVIGVCGRIHGLVERLNAKKKNYTDLKAQIQRKKNVDILVSGETVG